MKDTELHHGLSAPLAAALGLALALGSGGALAQEGDVNAVWTNEAGEPWTNESGECWRNPEFEGEPMAACGDEMPEEEPPVVQQEPEPASAAEPSLTTEIVVQELDLDARTLFGFGEATLTENGKDLIDNALNETRGEWELTRVEIRGYTDRIGSEQYNQQLSERRAQAVADYIRTRADMDGVELVVRGLGENDPVVQCENTGSRDALISCLAPNRRVEMDLELQRTVQRRVLE
jgi:OOP family OmpA-OmpF porin